MSNRRKNLYVNDGISRDVDGTQKLYLKCFNKKECSQRVIVIVRNNRASIQPDSIDHDCSRLPNVFDNVYSLEPLEVVRNFNRRSRKHKIDLVEEEAVDDRNDLAAFDEVSIEVEDIAPVESPDIEVIEERVVDRPVRRSAMISVERRRIEERYSQQLEVVYGELERKDEEVRELISLIEGRGDGGVEYLRNIAERSRDALVTERGSPTEEGGTGIIECKVCLMLYGEDLVVMKCGHVVCRNCCAQNFRVRKQCPICRTPLVLGDIFPCYI